MTSSPRTMSVASNAAVSRSRDVFSVSETSIYFSVFPLAVVKQKLSGWRNSVLSSCGRAVGTVAAAP